MRCGLEGVDALNRAIQERFRRRWKEIATAEGWRRKVPRPIGAQSILYGDKVINIVNQKRRDVRPALDGDAYIANGDLGIVVGQYKGKTSKLKGLPSKLEVEFAGQPGHKFGFWKGEFCIEGPSPAFAGSPARNTPRSPMRRKLFMSLGTSETAVLY